MFFWSSLAFSFFFLVFFFNFTILYWFCHISTWICHRYTCVPHPEPSSLLPPCTIPLGLAIWSLVPLPFLNPAWTSGSSVCILLKVGLENLEHYFASMWHDVFSIDYLLTSMCRDISCDVGKGCLLWPVCSLGKTVSLCPASFCSPRPNLPVSPVIF